MGFLDADVSVVQTILDELSTQSDRGAAIIAAAILDELLTEALQRRLILSNALRERLFSYEKNGPLANFSPKIDMAIAVGIITADMRHNLHLIRRIRNQFAHSVEPIKFTDDKITALCKELRIPNDDAGTPRRRYLMTCLNLVGIFGLTRQINPMRLTHFVNQREIEEQLNEFADDLKRRIATLEEEQREP